GASAHAIGTVKALEMGEVEGAMSSLAVAVAGLATVLAVPLAAGLY
ncbi:LrgB family protein, partial [Cloacibacillus evryensis]